MALTTRTARAAAAHVKRPGCGVTPGSTGTALGRAAVGWSYATEVPPPPGVGGTSEMTNLGGSASWQPGENPVLGGKSSFS
jgi:hypothetical protein